MMMIPRKRNELDILEDMFKNPFSDPFFRDTVDNRIMKTDIREKEDKYLIDVDLPGYEKDNIKMQIEDGYLTIEAATNNTKEEKEEGKVVRKERYVGQCSRSFYVGDDVELEDIKANFKNGTLRIEIAKKAKKEEAPQRKYIEIGD